MNREHIQLLMNRAVDGVATSAEREELARILRVDALLRSEFEDLQAIHASTESLFRQIALRDEFAKRIMRRIQTGEVPSDAGMESVRLPAQRPLNAMQARSGGHRRARLYAVIAAVSAAAAILLAAGVFSGFFARAGIGTQGVTPADGDDGSFTADRRQGVPGTEELHRTDSSTDQPSAKDDGAAPKGAPRRDPSSESKGTEVKKRSDSDPSPEPAPKKVNVDPLPPQPVNPEPIEPKLPDPRPENPDDVVKKDDTPAVEPEEPKGEVDKGTESDKTEAEPAKRVLLGTMQVLSGKAELVASDGSSSRLKEQDQQIFSGDRIRTRYDAVVMLQLASGEVTLGKDTQVLLATESELTLEPFDGKEKGVVALDRGQSDSGDSLLVHVESYNMYLMSGSAVVERKRKGMAVTKAIGFATVTHDSFGSIVLSEESGYVAEIEFGKEYSPPKAVKVKLPACAGETRAQAVMAALDPILAERTFTEVGERTYVNRYLPGKLNRLMLNPVSCESVVTMLTNSINNEKLVGADIVNLVGDVEIAYGNITELTPEEITEHAARAALAAEDYEQWRDYFNRLMRPPVEPKKQPSSTTTTESSDPTKLKRVENPPVKKVKSPTQNNGSDPAEEEEKDPE